MTQDPLGGVTKAVQKTLGDRLAPLEQALIPTWVLDAETFRVLWANQQALTLWNASSQAELLAREMRNVPEAILVRLRSSILRLRNGESHAEEWTLYPGGVPVRLMIHFSAMYVEDNQLVVLQQAVARQQVDQQQLRSVEAMMHTSATVAFVGLDGTILQRNPAATRTFGDAPTQWSEFLLHPESADELLQAVARNEPVMKELPVQTLQGERWHTIEMHRIRDAVTGNLVAIVHQTDITDRQRAEAEVASRQKLLQSLEQALATVDAQRRDILSLSAPLLDVAERTLALPLIGTLDAERSAEISGRLLETVSSRKLHTVILDLTGAGKLDGESTILLDRLVRAVQLLGARVLITGISASLAKALCEADIQLQNIGIYRTLSEGIRAAKLSRDSEAVPR